jgi:iron complex outermembrane receptor protein/outer membrane receptor for ferric coprogen and ferric-rhodotorulic acid
MFGTSWSVQDTFVGSTNSTGRARAVDIFNFNHDLLPEPATPAYVTQQELRNEVYGLYGSTRLELAKSLRLSLGGRLNWYKYRADNLRTGANISDYSQDAEFTPYAGLVYDLGPQWSVYASYADTFVTQSQYQNAGGDFLSPATGSNYEAGVKGELFDRKLNVAFAVFYIKKDGVAAADTPQPPTGCTSSNGLSASCYHTENQRSKGFDAEASGQIARGWQVAAGYTYLTSRDAKGLSLTSDAPRNLLRASTSYNLPGAWSDWTVGVNVAAQSSAHVETVKNPGHTVLDLRASYRINTHWTAALNIGNVTDKTYWAAIGSTIGGNYYGTPRNATLTLRGSF